MDKAEDKDSVLIENIETLEDTTGKMETSK
jgi:hypothetical protein